MKMNVDLHLRMNDEIEGKKLKNENGEFLVLSIHNATIFFDGYGQEGYEDALAYLDSMKKEIKKAWKRKGE